MIVLWVGTGVLLTIDTLIVCTMTALVILVSGLISFNDAGLMIITDT